MTTLTVDAPPQPVPVEELVTDEAKACDVKACDYSAEWQLVYTYCKCEHLFCNDHLKEILEKVRWGRANATHWHCRRCRGHAPVEQEPFRSVTPIH